MDVSRSPTLHWADLQARRSAGIDSDFTRARTLAWLDTAPAGRATIPVVRRVGGYTLDRRLGVGGMGQVWQGHRATLGGEATKVVAVKLLAGQRSEDPRYRTMFVQEARISMLLSHSNVVQVFDAGEDEGEAFMVMEWVDGVNLSELAKAVRERGEAMPLTVIAYIVGEVLRALRYAQTVTHGGDRIGVVHRDVSPQNVLLSVSGEVKLADFGVARLMAEDTSGLTIKGKLRYMAPEQLAGRSNDPRVDLYAAGALLHEMLDNRRFRDEAVDEAHLAGLVTSGAVPTLDNPDVPQELDELRIGLLQPEIDDRIATAERALEQLERWPGYSNAATRLSRLVRGITHVDAPRSGVHRAASGSVDQAAAPRTSAATETRTMTLASSPESGARKWPQLLVATIAGAVAAGALAIALFSARQGQSQPQAAPTEDTAPAVLVSTPVGEGTANAGSTTDPGGTELDGGPGVAPAPTEHPTELPSRSSDAAAVPPTEVAAAKTKKKKAKPAKVTVLAGALGWAVIRIAGQTKNAEAIAEFELRPGRHTIYVKRPKSDAFERAGSARFTAGDVARVRVIENPLRISVTR